MRGPGATVRRLGRYRLLLLLGQGGMGDVWLALQPGPFGFRKLVVVKELRAELSASAQSREMFLDEARLAARLNHPNVVQVLEVGEADGAYFIVMEYLEGQSLEAVRDLHPAPVRAELRAFVDVLAGLHHAHELRDFDGSPLGIVHRDMSPDNVFIAASGSTKVLDFGIAKASISSSQTDADQVKGKLAYMSPEQVRGEVLDRRTDVFSVGVMIWETIARRRLWTGESDVAIMYRLSHEQVPSIEPYLPAGAEALAAVLSRAMAPRPDERFETAAAFRAELDRTLAALPGPDDSPKLGAYVAQVFRDDLEARRLRIDEEVRRAEVSGEAGPSEAVAPEPGQRYLPREMLHRGRAAVYAGDDLLLSCRVVLKRFELRLEARALRRLLARVSCLSSPHTVRIFDVGALTKPQPSVFVVRAHVDGVALSELADGGPFSVDDARTISLHIAASLAEAHGSGVVHGQLCPQHVLVEQSADGPLATVIDYEGHALRLPPPEDAELFTPAGQPASPAADIRSAAALLFWMLGGPITADVWANRDYSGVSLAARTQLRAVVEQAMSGAIDRADAWADALRRTETRRSTSSSGRPLRLAANRFDLLASQEQTIWLFSDGPGISTPALAPAWAYLAQTYSLARLGPEERPVALDALGEGSRPLPWLVIFGDLHVLLEEPILAYLQPALEVGRLLVSSHANFELLESTVNAVGLDGQVCLPVQPDEVMARVTDVLTVIRARRARFDRIRKDVRAERGWVAAHARAATRSEAGPSPTE